MNRWQDLTTMVVNEGTNLQHVFSICLELTLATTRITLAPGRLLEVCNPSRFGGPSRPDEQVLLCSEFLIHAADVEGLCQGIDEELVQSTFGSWCTTKELTPECQNWASGARFPPPTPEVQEVPHISLSLLYWILTLIRY